MAGLLGCQSARCTLHNFPIGNSYDETSTYSHPRIDSWWCLFVHVHGQVMDVEAVVRAVLRVAYPAEARGTGRIQ
jgi:hypothetical protein